MIWVAHILVQVFRKEFEVFDPSPNQALFDSEKHPAGVQVRTHHNSLEHVENRLLVSFCCMHENERADAYIPRLVFCDLIW